MPLFVIVENLFDQPLFQLLDRQRRVAGAVVLLPLADVRECGSRQEMAPRHHGPNETLDVGPVPWLADIAQLPLNIGVVTGTTIGHGLGEFGRVIGVQGDGESADRPVAR